MRCVRLSAGSIGGRSTVCGVAGDDTVRDTVSSGLGASVVGDATRPLTAPVIVLVTLAARERPRIKLPRKLERGEVGAPGRSCAERAGGLLVLSVDAARPLANMLAAGIAMSWPGGDEWTLCGAVRRRLMSSVE
jgi:hypothetical protein